MKTLALLCLLVLLPCVWTRSVQEEREDDFDLKQLSKEDLIQFVKDATKVIKRTVKELKSTSGSSLSKRFWDYDLGHGFKAGLGGLTYTNGNFNANAKPSFTGGPHTFGLSYKF